MPGAGLEPASAYKADDILNVAPIPIPPPLINQNPSQKQPAGFDFSTFQIPEIPKELPIFNAKPYSMTDSTAKAFASNMGFTEEPFLVEENTTDGTQYDWQKGQETLILSQSRLIYQNNSLETDQDLSLDTLKQITFSFIQKASVIGEVTQQDSSKTKFLSISGGERLKSRVSLQDAQFAEFAFDKQLSGVTIVGEVPSTPYALTRIKKDGEVAYLASRFFENFTQGETYQIKSSKEVIEEIKSGKGKVVQTQILDENGQALELFRNQPENIELATITKLNLAYFLPDDPTQPIQPIFVFEGTFQSAKGENGKVIIYLPAIKQTK